MVHARGIVDSVLARAVAVLMGTLVLTVLWQVFTRFVLRDPSSWTEELARYLMIWVGLIGAAYAAGRHKHLAVDLLASRLSGRRARLLRIAVGVCAILFAVSALFGGGTRLVWVMLKLGQTSASLQVPLGYVYLALPLSGLLIAFYATLDLIDDMRRAA
ncbi:MAG: TRAP transporter small permease [Bacteroidota bacterium]|nr:TRAP transporter small permease [Bacteroidota bacterium]MDE2834622.1 TRAP transporter small permease [Bacteroidota bacterium]MDE2956566.1 TRAP transporter small permease [Bacteroidota bacterium]